MTCKCYLLPGNADNQTVPGRKELILIFLIGTDSDISPRIQAGTRREGHFPPLHTLGPDSVDTTGATVSTRVGELHLLRDFSVHENTAERRVSTHVC